MVVPNQSEAPVWTMQGLYYGHLDKLMQYCTRVALAHDVHGLFGGLRQLLNLVAVDCDEKKWSVLDKKFASLSAKLYSSSVVNPKTKQDNALKISVENEVFVELLRLQSDIYIMMKHLIKFMRAKPSIDELYAQMGVKK